MQLQWLLRQSILQQKSAAKEKKNERSTPRRRFDTNKIIIERERERKYLQSHTWNSQHSDSFTTMTGSLKLLAYLELCRSESWMKEL